MYTSPERPEFRGLTSDGRFSLSRDYYMSTERLHCQTMSWQCRMFWRRLKANLGTVNSEFVMARYTRITLSVSYQDI